MLNRYEVTLPPDALAHPLAFAPLPAETTARWSAAQAQGWQVCGQPGTRAIPAPRSDVGASARPGSSQPGGAGGAGAAGSRYLPPCWFPSLYYARQVLWGGIGGVRIYSSNDLPVPTRPAADPRWQPGKYRRSWPWTRHRPVMAAPVLPRWQWWRKSDAPAAHEGG